MALRILYDVAELGPHGQVGRGGIRRAIGNIAKELFCRDDVEVHFSGLSVRNACLAVPFLTSDGGTDHIDYGGVQLLDRLTDGAQRISSKLLSRRSRARRTAQQFIQPLQNLSERGSLRVSARALRDSDVFHSPFRPLPRRSLSSRGTAFFITVYDLIPITHPAFADDFFRDAARKILASITHESWIVCISQFVKDEICGYLRLPSERVFVTPLAASSDTFYPCEAAAAVKIHRHYGIRGGRYILSVGANDTRKNVAHLVECFAEVCASREVDDLSLVLVGNDASRETLLSGYGDIRERVIFTGYVPDRDLSPLYTGALGFFFPSLAEGFGLPPLEAMHCGLPVVSSNAGSLPEVVGEAGVLLNPDDKDGWCQAIFNIATNGRIREDLGRKSLARSEQFSWGRTVDALVEAYKHAVY